MGNSAFFRGKQQIQRQTVKSVARGENPHGVEYCRGILLALVMTGR